LSFKLFFLYIIFLEKINILKTTFDFDYLIKGIVLRQALWGANTFPTRNRLPNSFLVRRLIPYSFFSFFHSFFIKNNDGDSISFFLFVFIWTAISVVIFRSRQLATPLGTIILESSHLIKWSNLNVVFNICFFLFLNCFCLLYSYRIVDFDMLLYDLNSHWLIEWDIKP